MTPVSPPTAPKPPEGYATWLDVMFEHPGTAEFNAARAELEALRSRLAEMERAIEQAVREYDALGPDGPVMPGIDRWCRAALASKPTDAARQALRGGAGGR